MVFFARPKCRFRPLFAAYSVRNNSYDELASRYDRVKAEQDKVAGQIATLISTKTAAQQFIGTLRGLPQKVTAFNPETWGKMLNHATVYADGSIRFTFRNGIEI